MNTGSHGDAIGWADRIAADRILANITSDIEINLFHIRWYGRPFGPFSSVSL
jgi:hypothetical protein